MSSQPDSDERRPLLPQPNSQVPDERVASYSTSALAEGEGEPLIPDATRKDDEQAKELSWKWYMFYTFLLLGGALGMGWMIKSFIDAGDKEVCVFLFFLFLSYRVVSC